jgi:hypothetical protein
MASAEPDLFTAEEWREDLHQLERTIVQVHPNPFANIEEASFDQLVKSLDKEIGSLSDKEIVVRLAEIVGSIQDGHTRLSFPREHPEIGLEFGHAGTPLSNSPNLSFKQLPLAFEEFDDGIFVVGATRKFGNYIGSKLLSVDKTSSADAMRIVQRITFSENAQLQILMGADRLSLPEALMALGIVSDQNQITLVLKDAMGRKSTAIVEPLPQGKIDWIDAFTGQEKPLREQNPEKKFWYQYLPQSGILFAQIDEITDTEIKLAKFATEIVKEAERLDAKLVIDLRSNFGGSGDLNRTLELAIVQSKELNQYGRTFVITGRRTFSAAQFLVNFFDKYTRALFVGEPTGARPDHYGDSKKTRLENSGLTLRVSSLHWSSFKANDERSATDPDIHGPWNAEAYFSGRDPSLELIAGFQGSFESLLETAYRTNDEEKLERYLTDAILAPDSFDEDLSGFHVRLIGELIDEDNLESAKMVLEYGLYLHSDDEELLQLSKKLNPD